MSSLVAPSVGITLVWFSLKQIQASNLRMASLSFSRNDFLSHREPAHQFRVACSAKPETLEKVVAIVKKQLALPADQAADGAPQFQKLGAGSLDTVKIVVGLEEEFWISVEEESAQSITTVQDAADLIEKVVPDKHKCKPANLNARGSLDLLKGKRKQRSNIRAEALLCIKEKQEDERLL